MLVGCLSSQQPAKCISGTDFFSENSTCCRTETEAADQTFYLTQSQYTDTGPTSSSADPVTPGVWRGSRRSTNFEITGMTLHGKIPSAQAGFEARICRITTTIATATTTIILIIMIMKIIMITTTIIIAVKGANRDFSPHCAANCLQHVRSSGPGAVVQHIRRLLCNVLCYIPRRTKGQLSY